MMISLFESSTFSVSQDTSQHWLYLEWQGMQNEASALASCAMIIRFVKQTGVTKILCDSSYAVDGWDLLGNWMQQSYFPRLWENGIGSVAWVKAHDLITKHEIQEFAHHNNHPVINTFDSLASAYEWLQHFSPPTIHKPV